MADMWRLFIAIELPPNILDELTRVQADLKRRVPARTVRWVAPEGIHLTLKFLGDVPVSQRSDIERALVAAAEGFSPFRLSLSSLGCFPNTKRPRVVWTGVGGNISALGTLRDSVETHVAPLGYPTEARPFSPHLTLGRVRPEADRDRSPRIGALVEAAQAANHPAWDVEAISLMCSQLKPDGAIYTELLSVPLTPAIDR